MNQSKSGFTTVEVLITLLVGGILMSSGYEMFSNVMRLSSITRAQSKASNIAYSHLKRVANEYNATSCTTEAIIKEEIPEDDEKLPELKITSTISAPYGCSSNIHKVGIEVDYKLQNQSFKETQAIYVQK